MLEFHSDRSGPQVDDFDYCLVLVRWRLVIVLERGFERRAPADATLETFGSLVLGLMWSAADLAESSDYR